MIKEVRTLTDSSDVFVSSVPVPTVKRRRRLGARPRSRGPLEYRPQCCCLFFVAVSMAKNVSVED